MDWLDELLNLGGGETTLSPSELSSALSDELWMPNYVTAPSSAVYDLFDRAGATGYDSYGNGFPNFSTERSVDVPVSTGGMTYPEGYNAEDQLPFSYAPRPSGFDLGKLADKADAFLGSNLGKFAIGGLGGLGAYLDARKRNALMKKAYEDQLAQNMAKDAAYASSNQPIRWANNKTALGRGAWGASAPSAFSGNSLAAMSPRSTSTMYAARGGQVPGSDPGQGDTVPAMLSPGEYVFDADTVSALGDGNNAAGASALDRMRQSIRAHKRSAPVSSIPPKAKPPAAYLKNGVK